MKSATTIIAYVRANPRARPPPDLSTVPVSTAENFVFVFALSFARDLNRDGIFTPFWDDSITPELIVQLQQLEGNRFFMPALGETTGRGKPPRTRQPGSITQSLHFGP
jgi:hypothetical protein